MHICLDWLLLKSFRNFPWLQNTFSFVDRTLKNVPRLKMSVIWSHDVVADTNRKMSWIFIQGTSKKMEIFNGIRQEAETSEILVSREFSRIIFHFHFSFSISSRYNFAFTSRKSVKGFYFSLFTSRKKWKLSAFHSFFSRKKSEIRCGV